VVRQGDSVFSIGQRFGVTPQSIIDANQLKANAELVVGQTLVIPSPERVYRVMPGDSIWSIARKFNVSVSSIADLNNISNYSQIVPGMIVKIPVKAKKYGYIETNAFIQPSTPQRERSVLGESIQYLTYISPFSHHVNADASLTPLDDDTILEIAKQNRTAPMLSVTNISGENFSTTLISTILNDNNLVQRLIGNILTLMRSKGYYGVIIDFERIPPEDRNKYSDFLRKLVTALHPTYIVSVALAPKTYDITTGSWHGAHDYRAIGAIVDFVVIMTYEWGWSGGPPMAVAPLNEVRKVINYAVSVMPPSKIMMGMPLYGYDWTLPYIPGGEFAESVGNQEAIDRAGEHGAVIKYDRPSASPNYEYNDSSGKRHVVWFEDARSVEAKYKLVSEYGLRGVSYWVLAQPFPQNWQVLDDMFNIVKVIR